MGRHCCGHREALGKRSRGWETGGLLPVVQRHLHPEAGRVELCLRPSIARVAEKFKVPTWSVAPRRMRRREARYLSGMADGDKTSSREFRSAVRHDTARPGG